MKVSYKNIFFLTLIIAGIVLELGFQTGWRKVSGVFWSPTLWLIGGLLTVIGGWGLLSWRKTTIETTKSKEVRNKNALIVGAVFIFSALFIGSFLHNIFLDFEISSKNSDIVPSIQMYVQRLLGGETVYKPLVFESWTVLPTYFPMMWLPYVFSEVLNIDYRWTAYLVFLFGLALYIFRITKQEIPLWEMILKTLLPFLFIYYFIHFNPGTFGYSVELLPCGFYLILCFGLFHNRAPWLMSLGIFLCLMSRYAFTLWLPVCLLIYWIEFGFKSVFKLGMYVLLGVTLVYILPFLSKNWDLVADGLHYYQKTALEQWKVQTWQAPGSKPFHLFEGLSYSGWIYDNVAGTSPEKMDVAKLYHGLASLISASLLLLFYFVFRKKNLNVRLYLLVGLKFYLMFFYGFIYVPFSYLFMLPLMITLPIIYEIPWKDTIFPSGKHGIET